MLPLSLNVFKQKIVQVDYQTLTWRQCLENFIVVKQPREYGLCIYEEKIDIKWIFCEPAPEQVAVFVFVFVFFASYVLITRFLPSTIKFNLLKPKVLK